jgi:hypothetical protein
MRTEKVIQQWFGGSDLTLIICLKKMQFIFIKRVKPLATTQSEFYPKYKNNVMPISGTHRHESVE